MRAAPSIGPILVGAFLLRRPLKNKDGVIMFACVAMVGVAIAVFGATTQVWLLVTALALIGGLGMVASMCARL